MRPEFDCLGSLRGCAGRTLSLMAVVLFGMVCVIVTAKWRDHADAPIVAVQRAACAAARALDLADQVPYQSGAEAEAYWSAANDARTEIERARVSCAR